MIVLASVLFSADSQEIGFNLEEENSFGDRGDSLSDDLKKKFNKHFLLHFFNK